MSTLKDSDDIESTEHAYDVIYELTKEDKWLIKRTSTSNSTLSLVWDCFYVFNEISCQNYPGLHLEDYAVCKLCRKAIKYMQDGNKRNASTGKIML